MNPIIRPVPRLIGKTLEMRDARERDAAFILSLRTDPQKSRHLSPVSALLEDQRAWLRHYAVGQGQAYFILWHAGLPIGTVRLYDGRGDSFCWGSWILIDSRPRHAAVESALMVYAFALDHLGFARTHFDVRAGNARVRAFHERMGAVQTGQDGEDVLYKIDPDALLRARAGLRDFLPNGVRIADAAAVADDLP